MKSNPYLNAAGAAAYIGAVVLFLQFLQSLRQNTPDSPIDGMGAISLLVFSVAVMAFLFFYRPALLLIENKKAEALSFFFKTLAAFGLITAIVFAIVALQ